MTIKTGPNYASFRMEKVKKWATVLIIYSVKITQLRGKKGKMLYHDEG